MGRGPKRSPPTRKTGARKISRQAHSVEGSARGEIALGGLSLATPPQQAACACSILLWPPAQLRPAALLCAARSGRPWTIMRLMVDSMALCRLITARRVCLRPGHPWHSAQSAIALDADDAAAIGDSDDFRHGTSQMPNPSSDLDWVKLS